MHNFHRRTAGRRGQVFVLDLVFGVIIFLFAVASASALWEDLFSQVQSAEQRKDLEFGVFSSSELLMRTSGNPVGWNSSGLASVKSLGLAAQSNGSADGYVLNASKAVFFVQLLESNYSDAKSLLGAGAYDFGFSITDKSHQVVNVSCNPGCFCGPPCWKTLNYSTAGETGASDAAAIKRAAVLEYVDSTGSLRRQIVNLNVFWWA